MVGKQLMRMFQLGSICWEEGWRTGMTELKSHGEQPLVEPDVGGGRRVIHDLERGSQGPELRKHLPAEGQMGGKLPLETVWDWYTERG